MSFDLRALGHVVAVAEAGGFARAARHLRLSQPSLSRSIAGLEATLGAALFDRAPTGTRLTEAGHRFLDHARTILHEVARAQRAFGPAEDDMAAARVVIGLSPSLLHHGFPDAVAGLVGGAAAIGLDVRTGTFEQLIAGLKDRGIDLALCLVPFQMIARRDDMAAISFEELGREMVLPVARADHPVFAAPVSLAAAGGHGWAVPHQMSVSYRFETAFFRHDLPNPLQRLTGSSMALLKRAVCEWGLIGLLPHALVEADLAAGGLRTLDVPELHFPAAITLMRLRDAAVRPAMASVIAALRDQL